MTTIQYAGFVVAGLVIGGGLVNASTTPAVIQACADNTSGALRLGRCSASETSVSWNQQGVQGPQGAQGPSSARSVTYDGPIDSTWIQSPSICGPGGPNPLPYIAALNYHCHWHTAYLGDVGYGEHLVTAKVVIDQDEQFEYNTSSIPCELHLNEYVLGPTILDAATSYVSETSDFWWSHSKAPLTLLGSIENTAFGNKKLFVTCRSYYAFDAQDIKAHIVTVDEVTSVQLP
jgi:hypothetical protein